MDRRTVIAKLRKHEPELRASGITGLSLFGSVARDENTPKSDVDLMAEFDQSMRITLFSLSGIRLRIADILGTSVDLADRHMLKDQVKERAEREAILVF